MFQRAQSWLLRPVVTQFTKLTKCSIMSPTRIDRNLAPMGQTLIFGKSPGHKTLHLPLATNYMTAKEDISLFNLRLTKVDQLALGAVMDKESPL
jgi:hypothetical protein